MIQLNTMWLLHRKQAFYWILTLIGVGCAYYFNSAQIEKAKETIEGISLGMYISFTTSMFLGLILAWQAKNLKLILQFLAWTIGGTILSSFVWIEIEEYQWLIMDTIILVCSMSGLIFTIVRSIFIKNINFFKDKATKGLNSIFLKSIPQFGIGALIFLTEGGGGLTLTAIVVGHLSILMRLLVLWLEKEKNEDSVWIKRSDQWNFISWIFVTVIWCIYEIL